MLIKCRREFSLPEPPKKPYWVEGSSYDIIKTNDVDVLLLDHRNNSYNFNYFFITNNYFHTIEETNVILRKFKLEKIISKIYG